METINLELVTVQDCIDMYEKKGEVAIISNGKLTGFTKEDGNNGK